jgi:hypothetical protein
MNEEEIFEPSSKEPFSLSLTPVIWATPRSSRTTIYPQAHERASARRRFGMKSPSNTGVSVQTVWRTRRSRFSWTPLRIGTKGTRAS